jgi:hypothetical protein
MVTVSDKAAGAAPAAPAAGGDDALYKLWNRGAGGGAGLKLSHSGGGGAGSNWAPPEVKAVAPPTDAGQTVLSMYDPKNMGKALDWANDMAKPDTTEEDAYKATLKALPEKLAKEKKQDFWQTLTEIGFGMAAGSSPNALQNIGAAASAAMPAMEKRKEAREAEEREGQKDLVALENQKNQRQMARVNLAMSVVGQQAQALGQDLSREQAERFKVVDTNLANTQMLLQWKSELLRDATTRDVAAINASVARNTPIDRAAMQAASVYRQQYPRMSPEQALMFGYQWAQSVQPSLGVPAAKTAAEDAAAGNLEARVNRRAAGLPPQAPAATTSGLPAIKPTWQ